MPLASHALKLPENGEEFQPLPDLGTQVSCRFLDEAEASNPEAKRSLVVVIEPRDDGSPVLLQAFLRTHRAALLDLCARYGSVLFRGFDLSLSSYEQVVESAFAASRYLWMFPLPPRVAAFLLKFPVIGSLLLALLGRIEASATGRSMRSRTISKLASDDTIQFPHHEYGIFFNIPRLIAFYCEQESQREGETFICDAEAAWQALDPALRARFEHARYIRYRSQNQWYLPPFSAPAILHHPETGAPTINLTAYHHDAMAAIAREYYPSSRIVAEDHDETFSFEPRFVGQAGERYELTPDEISGVIHAHLSHSVLLRWRTGDLLLMDNFKTLHGRVNAGIPRKSLHVMLCEYVRNQNGFVWR